MLANIYTIGTCGTDPISRPTSHRRPAPPEVTRGKRKHGAPASCLAGAGRWLRLSGGLGRPRGAYPLPVGTEECAMAVSESQLKKMMSKVSPRPSGRPRGLC